MRKTRPKALEFKKKFKSRLLTATNFKGNSQICVTQANLDCIADLKSVILFLRNNLKKNRGPGI
jgi:hypothetical protein